MVGWKSVDHCSNQHVKHVEHDKHCSTNVEIWWNFIDFWFMLMDLHGLWWLQNLSTIKIHQNLWKSIVWRCQFCFKDFNSWKIKQLLELLQKLSLQVTKARTATAQRDKRGMERSQAMVPCCEGGKFKVKIWWTSKIIVKTCEVNRTWRAFIHLYSVFKFDDDQSWKLKSCCWKYPRWAYGLCEASNRSVVAAVHALLQLILILIVCWPLRA